MGDLQHIIDQLREAHDDIGRRIEALQAEREPIEAALLALGSAWRVTIEPTVAVAKVAAHIDITHQAATDGERKVKRRGSKVDWTELAGWVRTTQADGTYTYAAMLERFGPTAKNWRRELKIRGLLDGDSWGKNSAATIKAPTPAPAPAPAPKPVPVTTPAANGRGTILACSECSATFLVTEAKALAHHTITTHKRGPLSVERTPVTA